MPRRALVRIMVAAVIGLAVWIPASVASAADPCCQVALGGIPGQFTAGGDAKTFTSTMRFDSQQQGREFQSISAKFTFQVQDIDRGQIKFARQQGNGWRNISVSGHGHAFTATDRFTQLGPLSGGGGAINSTYRLSFGDKVKSQAVSITILATAGGNGHGGQQAKAGPYQTSVGGTVLTPTPTATAKPNPVVTPTPTVTTAPPSPVGQAPSVIGAPAGAQSDGGSSGGGVAWIAYIVGALLLIGGVGVIGTMLWRRGAQPVAAQWTDPSGYDAGPTYPTQAFGTPPTQAYGGQPPAAYGAQPTQVYGTQPTYGAGAPPAYDPTGQAPTTAQPPPPRHGLPPMDPTRQMPPL
jgi:hypothetical protein